MTICVYSVKRMAVIGGFVLLIIASIAHADVSCSITMTNSEASTTESTSVSNAEYQSFSLLNPSSGWGGFPSSILSVGSGKSTSSSGDFSQSVSVSGGQSPGSMNAKVKTQNGAFAWSKDVDIGSENPNTYMNVATSISNGVMDSAYSNSYSNAEKGIQTINSKYFDRTTITPNLVISAGKGESLKEIGNEFSSNLVGETFDKKGTMTTGLKFLRSADLGADSEWSDRMLLSPEGGLMSQSVTVLSNKYLLEDDKVGSGQITISPMEFTPYNSRTGSKMFETQYIPGKDSYPFCIRIVDKGVQNRLSNVDQRTLSMGAQW